MNIKDLNPTSKRIDSNFVSLPIGKTSDSVPKIDAEKIKDISAAMFSDDDSDEEGLDEFADVEDMDKYLRELRKKRSCLEQ